MLDFGFYNMDCMEGMKEFPDKYFDLAIVDPPYGIGVQTMQYTKTGKRRASRKSEAACRDYRRTDEWDIKPSEEYFRELKRVSKSQIIWGGNYFSDILPPSRSFIVWDKRTTDAMRNDFADCEYAWMSKGLGVARVFRYLWNGMLQGDMKNKEQRFHPTQKPVALYRWILSNYAKQGDKLLDTHVGSASSLIAFEERGFDYVGFEIDADYYQKAQKRLEENRAQISMDFLRKLP